MTHCDESTPYKLKCKEKKDNQTILYQILNVAAISINSEERKVEIDLPELYSPVVIAVGPNVYHNRDPCKAMRNTNYD